MGDDWGIAIFYERDPATAMALVKMGARAALSDAFMDQWANGGIEKKFTLRAKAEYNYTPRTKVTAIIKSMKYHHGKPLHMRGGIKRAMMSISPEILFKNTRLDSAGQVIGRHRTGTPKVEASSTVWSGQARYPLGHAAPFAHILKPRSDGRPPIDKIAELSRLSDDDANRMHAIFRERAPRYAQTFKTNRKVK